MLCAICIFSNSEEGKHIYEAMTIVHGTAVCHEHGRALYYNRDIERSVLDVNGTQRN
jgi:hypothetical protein